MEALNGSVLPQEIKVIDFIEMQLGIEPEKDCTLALFPSRIVWCDPQIDAHIAELDEALRHESEILIQSSSRDYKLGIYKKIPHPNPSMPQKREVYEA